MGFALEKVVPWGRSFDEYVRMFSLSEGDLELRVLGCGDGPAAFNSELTKRGGNVISVDPIYKFTADQIKIRISETYEKVISQLHKNKNDYIWEVIPSVEWLGSLRMSAMQNFLADFEVGKREGRYIVGELPSLPFDRSQFDIALSSHFLFLYSDQLSEEFHIQALQEILHVAQEVRVFPLLSLDGSLSPHLRHANDHFSNHGFTIEIRRVPYEFQRGGTEMLIIKRS